MRFLVVGLLLGCSAWGQTSLGGPESWYVFDPLAKSLRRAAGVPGSMHLQPTFVENIENASVAPDGTTVIACRENTVAIGDFSGRGDGELHVIEGAAADLSNTEWAADVSAFIRYAPDGRLQKFILTNEGWRPGLPEQPVVGASDVRILALGPGARLTLATAAGRLYIWRQGSDPLEIPGAFSSAAISSDGQSVFVAEPGGAIKKLINGSELVDFVGANAEAEDTTAIALSKNGANVLLASGARRSIRVYDAVSGAFTTEVWLDARPTLIQRVSKSAFLIAAPVGPQDPFWLFSETPMSSTHFLPVGSRP